MKSLITSLALAIFVFMASSCENEASPKGYVGRALSIIDENGLYADSEQWSNLVDSIKTLTPGNMDEAHAIISRALAVGGGKHSFLMSQVDVNYFDTAQTVMPTVKYVDDIAVITIPMFMSNKSAALSYVKSVTDALRSDIRGAVVDLRGNTGGNMTPMIAALHQFLPSSILFRMKGRSMSTPMNAEFTLRQYGLSAARHIDCRVAILTDSLTASSGEATLICFRGLNYTRTFGSPTAGYASANDTYTLLDGYRMVLTVGCDIARTGEVFCSDPIVPDVLTSSPLEDALAWLSE